LVVVRRQRERSARRARSPGPRHFALTWRPPAEIVNTAFPLSVPPDAVVGPPRTVIWPPVANVSSAPSMISTASLAERYDTVNFVIGCKIVSFLFESCLPRLCLPEKPDDAGNEQDGRHGRDACPRSPRSGSSRCHRRRAAPGRSPPPAAHPGRRSGCSTASVAVENAPLMRILREIEALRGTRATTPD
jgi:hypothetical protein